MSFDLNQYVKLVADNNLNVESVFDDYKKKVEDSILNKENIYLRVEKLKVGSEKDNYQLSNINSQLK
jgi:hypothetical protein